MENRVPSTPPETGPGPPPHLADPPEEGLLSKAGWPIHGLAVILGAPAGAVDVDVVGVQAQRTCLHRICHLTVQHAHPWPQRGAGKGMLRGFSYQGQALEHTQPCTQRMGRGGHRLALGHLKPLTAWPASVSLRQDPGRGKGEHPCPHPHILGQSTSLGFQKCAGEGLPCQASEWAVRLSGGSC